MPPVEGQDARDEAAELARIQSMSSGRVSNTDPEESEECAKFRRQQAAFQADVATDAEAAFERRKAELQSVDEVEFFSGRVRARMDRGQSFADAVVGANEDLSHRNVVTADGRMAGAFVTKAGCR